MLNPDRHGRVGKQRASYDANSPQLPGFNHEAWKKVTIAGDVKRSEAYLQNYSQRTGTPVSVLKKTLWNPRGGLR